MKPSRDARLTMVIVAFLFGALACSLALKTSAEDLPTLEKTLQGTARLPFQHRVLAPWTIHLIQLASGGQASLPVAAAVFYTLAFTLVFYCYYWFLRLFFDHHFALFCDVLLLLAILIGWLAFMNINDLPARGLRYPFDVTGVLFFVLLAHAAMKDRLGWWYVLLAVATLNRETVAVLIPFLGLLLWQRRGWRQAIGPVAISLAVFGAVKGTLAWVYPGTPVEWQLARNLYFLGAAYGSDTLLSLIFVYGGLWLFAPLGFRRLPPEMRYLFIALPFALVALVLFGWINETRIYDDYAVFVIPAGVLGIQRLVAERS